MALPLRLGEGDEKLRVVGVRPRICHRECSRTGVLQGEVLILKGVPIDGLASSAIVVSEISSLGHLEGEKKKRKKEEEENKE